VRELGLFRILFGKAPLNHVGRGIGHVLPVLVAGLLADPLLGEKNGAAVDLPLGDYLDSCPYIPCLALEEIESHLHPKAQSRLAHVLVALARSGRQLLVETHSDHLVRRLRGLVARSAPGSETERWLLENIGIVEVDQTPEGATVLTSGHLTREGTIERWPADFMDEATDEERAIYFAAAAKSPPEPPPVDEAFFEDAPPPGADAG
jgi:AAA domain, putative AbiEii toxin, Type IV TA system